VKVIQQELISEIVQRLVVALQPDMVYLYGSHAYGQPHENSDIDLLIVTRDATSPVYQQTVQAYRALRGLCVPAEVKVVTRQQFERRSRWLSSIERTVKEKGRLLYDSRGGRGRRVVA